MREGARSVHHVGGTTSGSSASSYVSAVAALGCHAAATAAAAAAAAIATIVVGWLTPSVLAGWRARSSFRGLQRRCELMRPAS